jgi:hypothetical protein
MQAVSPQGVRDGTVGSVSFVDTILVRDDRHRREGALPCDPMVQPADVHSDVRPLSVGTMASHHEVAR